MFFAFDHSKLDTIHPTRGWEPSHIPIRNIVSSHMLRALVAFLKETVIQ